MKTNTDKKDRKIIKPSKTQSTKPQEHFNFSTWVSSNFPKIIVISLLIVTVAVVFFVRNDAVSILYSGKSRSKSLKPIQFPKISFSSIPPNSDKSSPFATFRSERWIVVSVSNYPSDSLRSLVKIKGWQVLAVGNSRTPANWELKGAIFLSLEQQAKLEFRILEYLPYDSYVRKSVGYLFAIQHGAKMIFDADDRGEVIDWEVGKRFDLDLFGVDAMQERILQYNRENPNRTVVNPYIHFGQRSVWPRGLPLENVGEIVHEEYYNEVFGGMQFIQQGISNGLPDVDSVFYLTRKLDSEAFDMSFDEHALKVALPQGVMVPLNSFNTLFHSNAFWGLMLPVSVSSMASDVLRGYWAQRLLWEVGGFVVVYPPTIYRKDEIEAYPFSEEKDLHDLLAVGYQQPRLMALELDRPRASSGDADRKEFIPRKLPSVHLAVEESGAVNYEIGNLISGTHCLWKWRLLYGRIFKTVVILSAKSDVDLAVEEAHPDQVYKYLPKIFERFSSAEGFLFLQDNTILNYWNLMQGDKTKLWITDKVPQSWTTISLIGNNSVWFSKQAKMVKKVVNTMPVHLQVGYKESSTSEPSLTICSSEVFYIPQSFVGDFVDLVGLVGNAKIHHKVALPMFFMAMDSPLNFDSLLNTMIYNTEALSSNPSDYYSAKVAAVHPWSISSEPDFIKLIRLMAAGDPLLMELF
uniref:Glycosyltransferase STELLO1 n=1 Tax=Vitis vinifera TaxID=29760 RepID=A5AD91_VITVI|nr:hypothetical protein VITISV_029810 [Vitis vinifera]